MSKPDIAPRPTRVPTFTRDLIATHCGGAAWPTMVGAVVLGESFVVETERFNRVNGPIAIEGVQAGDDIVVHVEAIEIEPPFEAPNGGPFFEGMGQPVPLDYRDHSFHFPNGVRLPAKPSVGNIGVLPASTDAIRALIERDLGPARADHRGWGWRAAMNDPRGKHCHQDCQALMAGARIHLKAQVAQGGLCVADVHGYIGQGEMAFAAIEVAARVQLRVERSTGWYVDWPLIETDDEIMVFISDTNLLDGGAQQYVDVVRAAYAEMRKVVAHKLAGSIADANAIVATALDVRNCALYGLGNFVQPEGEKRTQPDQDIAVVGVLPKSIFA